MVQVVDQILHIVIGGFGAVFWGWRRWGHGFDSKSFLNNGKVLIFGLKKVIRDGNLFFCDIGINIKEMR